MSLGFKVDRGKEGVIFEIRKDNTLIYKETFLSLSSLKERISHIIESCEEVLKRSEEIFSLIEEEKDVGCEEEKDPTPEDLWKRIERMTSEDEVVAFFNSLSLEVRKALSSYVLSSVNMFKGKGMIFAQYFDHKRCVLDKEIPSPL